jgi:hypothetical protein
MQEGAISLLQMAKTVAALDRFKDAGLPFLSLMTDPCLGGMTASYAMLGDVNIAEPGAYIGFAGRRVIEQTIRQSCHKMPPPLNFAKARHDRSGVEPRRYSAGRSSINPSLRNATPRVRESELLSTLFEFEHTLKPLENELEAIRRHASNGASQEQVDRVQAAIDAELRGIYSNLAVGESAGSAAS